MSSSLRLTHFFSLLLSLLLAACASPLAADSTPTPAAAVASATPIPSFTPEPTATWTEIPPTATLVPPTPAVPQIYEGVPPNLESFPRIKSLDQVPLLVQYWRGKAQAEIYFFDPKTPSVEVDQFSPGDRVLAICPTTTNVCIKNLASFSIMDTRTGKDHYFVIRAFKVDDTIDDPKGIVVLATWIGIKSNERFFSYGAEGRLEFLQLEGGFQRVEIITMRKISITDPSLELMSSLLNDQSYSDFLLRIFQSKQLVNFDKPVMSLPDKPIPSP